MFLLENCLEITLKLSSSINKLSLLLSGHFTKDCFSAPGLQYALLPEEDDAEPQQQQQQPSTVSQQQDSDKKKKKKKVNTGHLRTVLSSFPLFPFLFVSLAISHLMQQPTHLCMTYGCLIGNRQLYGKCCLEDGLGMIIMQDNGFCDWV